MHGAPPVQRAVTRAHAQEEMRATQRAQTHPRSRGDTARARSKRPREGDTLLSGSWHWSLGAKAHVAESRVYRERGEERGDTLPVLFLQQATNPGKSWSGAGDGTRTRDTLLGRQARVLAPPNCFPRLVPGRSRSEFDRVNVIRWRQAHYGRSNLRPV